MSPDTGYFEFLPLVLREYLSDFPDVVVARTGPGDTAAGLVVLLSVPANGDMNLVLVIHSAL